MTTYRLKACCVGVLPVPGWECFFARNDTTLHDLAFYVWIVRGRGTIGLVDAGLPVDPDDLKTLTAANQTVDKRCVYRNVVSLKSLLAREKIRPEHIDFLAITQPITYHTGGLLEKYFPRAHVFMSRAGVVELLTENVGHPPRGFYFTASTWAFLRMLLIQDRLHLVDAETEIRPRLLFETTGGHHPGSAAVRVKTKRGVVGILETAFLQRNVDEELPIGVAEDVAACRRAIKRYKRICAIVAADHEPSLAKRFDGD